MPDFKQAIKALRNRFGRPVNLYDQVDAYRRVPKEVIADLASFCGAIDPAPVTDNPLAMARAEGRRDVWLHIQHQRQMEAEEVYMILQLQRAPTIQEV